MLVLLCNVYYNKTSLIFFLHAQDCIGAPAIYLIYTRCIGRMHSLATTSGFARKVGVILIIKMADLEQILLNLSSRKIR